MQDIDSEHLELIKSLLTAFAQGDGLRISSLMTDDVVLHFPGQNQFAGDYKGKAEAGKLLAGLNAWTGGRIQVRLHDVLANEQHGVLMYTVTAHHEDQEITYRYINIYHFRDNQVSEVWGIPQDAPGFDAFYSK